MNVKDKDKEFKFWPIVSEINKDNLDTSFVDSLRMFPSYHSGFAADYDGDSMTLRGIFTDEANEECEQRLDSIVNIANFIGNKSVRDKRMVTNHVLYNLTREEDEI